MPVNVACRADDQTEPENGESSNVKWHNEDKPFFEDAAKALAILRRASWLAGKLPFVDWHLLIITRQVGGKWTGP